ncbi:MAG: MFS transporter [Treponema sp.]|jgi:HEAT repeat protein|nr:MFS transporter [Treponema sp.]
MKQTDGAGVPGVSFPLSPHKQKSARLRYNVFNICNAISWQFLVGNVLSLFALRMGASSTYIGLLSALAYVSYFFLVLGKALSRRFPIVVIFACAWIVRSLAMLPLAAAPFVYAAGLRDTALVLCLLGTAAFHFFRGIGMIANNPVLSYLAAGPDRGAYMTLIQIINSVTGMLAGVAIALVLEKDPPLFLYGAIFGAGILSGVASGVLVRGAPEPPAAEPAPDPRTMVPPSSWSVYREAFANQGLRRFVIIFLLAALSSAIARTFITVYAREVFQQDDAWLSLYAVAGSLGNVAIGLLIKFLVDRIGAKPLFMTCILTALLGMIPIIAFPLGWLGRPLLAAGFLAFTFFIINLGFLGAENIAQTYFLSLIPERLMVDMGILYFFVFGVAGAAGAFAGGIVLDTMAGVGLSYFMAFKLLYLALILCCAVTIVLQRGLVPLGALSFRRSLALLFSVNDLKAISLLDRLHKSSDSDEEEALLEALHGAPSSLATAELLQKARSPRLSVRQDALRAIDALKTLESEAEGALKDDLKSHPYTTAYLSARILGTHGVMAAIPLLRECLGSKDYMLAGEAMLALARLGDSASRPAIEALTAGAENPRLKIMGVEALGLYGDVESLSVLLNLLLGKRPPPYLRDETVLAMAEILNTEHAFYPLLVRFGEDESCMERLALDEAEAALGDCKGVLAHGNRRRGARKGGADAAAFAEAAARFLPAIAAFIREGAGGPLSAWILSLPERCAPPIALSLLAEAVLDADLSGHRRLKLFIAHWACAALRAWAKEH